MAELKGNVQNALDEARTLILGSQILIGFQYESIFQKGFGELPELSQHLKLLALGLMVLSMVLLMAPTSFHRIVERGNDSRRLLLYTTRLIAAALLPFAIGFGIDIFVMFDRLAGPGIGLTAGVMITLAAIFFWYAFEMMQNIKGAKGPRMGGSIFDTGSGREETSLKDRVRHVLTEARVVLPGAQALLGFQFIAMMTEPFKDLPRATQYVHAASLLAVAVSTILLMTPAAYHRLVDRGEDTERFHQLAGRFVLAAMLPLALGVSGDIYVVMQKVLGSMELAGVIAGAMLLVFALFWWGLPRYLRARCDRIEMAEKLRSRTA